MLDDQRKVNVAIGGAQSPMETDEATLEFAAEQLAVFVCL